MELSLELKFSLWFDEEFPDEEYDDADELEPPATSDVAGGLGVAEHRLELLFCHADRADAELLRLHFFDGKRAVLI